MNFMKKNLVVIGYGGMGTWHTQHALKSDVVNLAGVYDINPEKNKLAEERGIFAYDSYEAVLADEKVDLITVAIPILALFLIFRKQMMSSLTVGGLKG